MRNWNRSDKLRSLLAKYKKEHILVVFRERQKAVCSRPKQRPMSVSFSWEHFKMWSIIKLNLIN